MTFVVKIRNESFDYATCSVCFILDSTLAKRSFSCFISLSFSSICQNHHFSVLFMAPESSLTSFEVWDDLLHSSFSYNHTPTGSRCSDMTEISFNRSAHLLFDRSCLVAKGQKGPLGVVISARSISARSLRPVAALERLDVGARDRRTAGRIDIWIDVFGTFPCFIDRHEESLASP